MKKRILGVLVVIALFVSACSSDDDKDSSNDCQTCNQELEGQNISSEICDNGDGTFTITFLNEEETEDLNGATFEQIIAAYEALGATCN